MAVNRRGTTDDLNEIGRPGELRLYQLSGTKYIDHSVAEMGEVLRLTEPVAVSIDPAELQLRR